MEISPLPLEFFSNMTNWMKTMVIYLPINSSPNQRLCPVFHARRNLNHIIQTIPPVSPMIKGTGITPAPPHRSLSCCYIKTCFAIYALRGIASPAAAACPSPESQTCFPMIFQELRTTNILYYVRPSAFAARTDKSIIINSLFYFIQIILFLLKPKYCLFWLSFGFRQSAGIFCQQISYPLSCLCYYISIPIVTQVFSKKTRKRLFIHSS